MFQKLKCVIEFDALYDWDHPEMERRHLQYQFVTDEEIESLLHSEELDCFQLSDSWSNLTDNHSTLNDNPIHAKVIAKLVYEIRNGCDIAPVNINSKDTYCCYCVTDGHHRLRALQFLKKRSFQAYISGDRTDFDRLLNKNK